MQQNTLFPSLTQANQTDPQPFTIWQFCLISDNPELLEAAHETARAHFGVLCVDYGWYTRNRLDLFIDCRLEVMEELFKQFKADGLKPRVNRAERPS